MNRLRNLIVILFCLGFFHVSARDRVYRVIDRADRFYEQMAYSEALPLYNKATVLGIRNAHVCRRLGDCFLKVGRPEEAAPWLAHVVLNEGHTNEDILFYARALRSIGRFEESDRWMMEYKEATNSGDNEGENTALAQSRRLRSMSSPFRIFDAGTNTPEDEFAPSWIDNGQVMFSSARERWGWFKMSDGWTGDPFTDMYVADRDNSGQLSRPRLMSGAMSTTHNDGPAVCDQRTRAIYYTTNLYKDEHRRWQLGIMKAEYVRGLTWRQAGAVWKDSSPFPAFHPALSADGNTLVFASDRPGGIGGADLYVSRLEQGTWTEPLLLTGPVNSPGDELFPFLAADGRLFFASNGHIGLGGLDIFMCRLTDTGYTEPLNLGAPVNSVMDDLGFIIDVSGHNGYFSSNRTGGHGGDDIYGFQLTGEIEPLPYQCAGIVSTAEHDAPRFGAEVWLCDAEGHVLDSMLTKANGSYAFDVVPGTAYTVHARQREYFDAVERIMPGDLSDQRVLVRDLRLLAKNGLWLRGTVRNASDGAPLLGARIILSDLSGGRRTLSSDAGGAFHARLEPGETYDLVVSRSGYWSATVALLPDKQRYKVIDLANDPALTLEPMAPGGLRPIIEAVAGNAASSEHDGVTLAQLLDRMRATPEASIVLVAYSNNLPAKSAEEANESIAAAGTLARKTRSEFTAKGISRERVKVKVLPGNCPFAGIRLCYEVMGAEAVVDPEK